MIKLLNTINFAFITYSNLGNPKLPIILKNTSKIINLDKAITVKVYLSWANKYSQKIQGIIFRKTRKNKLYF